MYYILIFESTHKVLKSEKLLLANGVIFDIIPTPKELSSDCGMSIRINPKKADFPKVKMILEIQGIKFVMHEKLQK